MILLRNQELCLEALHLMSKGGIETVSKLKVLCLLAFSSTPLTKTEMIKLGIREDELLDIIYSLEKEKLVESKKRHRGTAYSVTPMALIAVKAITKLA